MLDSLSPQKRVTAQTPPAFLAHGDADDLVPIQNSRMSDSACKAAKVQDTLVVEPGKNHSFGMDWAWPNALKDWMQKRGLLNNTVSLQGFPEKARSRENRAVVGFAPVKGIYLVRLCRKFDKLMPTWPGIIPGSRELPRQLSEYTTGGYE